MVPQKHGQAAPAEPDDEHAGLVLFSKVRARFYYAANLLAWKVFVLHERQPADDGHVVHAREVGKVQDVAPPSKVLVKAACTVQGFADGHVHVLGAGLGLAWSAGKIKGNDYSCIGRKTST